MKILIAGICGFVGSSLARQMLETFENLTVIGIDNFSRKGSEVNRESLIRQNVRVLHGDVRMASDLESLATVDWVIDAAAYPSVLAGSEGCTSRQLYEHNLLGTLNLLEYCRRHRSGFILLSSSRVYSIDVLQSLPLKVVGEAFQLESPCDAMGLTAFGIQESFSTKTPLSLYGSSKLASELIASEYGMTFDFPVWINRCGLLAGAGQFGRPDQGIIAYWIHTYSKRRALKYVGFGGKGHQVRDILHPRDLGTLIARQISVSRQGSKPTIWNVGGGVESALSLAQLTRWCQQRFGDHRIESSDETRIFDVPWIVLDSQAARDQFDWRPEMKTPAVLEEIAVHSETHPHWLELSN